MLFILVADEITRASKECETEKKDQPMMCTWADDITAVINNRITLSKVIIK